jgi:hypothetical protein
MNRTLTSSKRIILGLVSGLVLGLLLLPTSPTRASSTHRLRLHQCPAMVRTNNPDIFAFPAPPVDFDPTTASTAALQCYGFPLPPDPTRYPNEYQQWVQVVQSAKEYVLPSFTLHPDISHNNATTANWSGTVVTAPINGPAPTTTFTGASGIWAVPDVATSTQTSYSNTWVGLDGTLNQQVEQIGTEQDAFPGSCGTFGCYASSTRYYAWVELFPDPEQQINGFTVSPGDQIYASVGYYPQMNNLDFVMFNVTTQQFTMFQWAAKYGAPGISAEWVQERPTVNNVLPALANFGKVEMDVLIATTSDGGHYEANKNPFNPTQVDMVNGNDLLANTVPIVNPIASWSNVIYWDNYL